MVTENISRYVWLGRNDKHWYADCRQTIIELFGEDRLPLVANLLAATSINTSLKANIYLFRKAYYEIQNSLPVSNYLPNIQQQLAQIRAGGQLTGQKINAFARAMQGDTQAVVVDIWLMRAFSIPGDSPTKRQFKAVESWVRQEAIYRECTPAQLSAMIWGGVRREQSGDNQTRFCDFLKYQFNNLFQCV